MSKKISPKVVRIKRRGGFYSIRLSVVHYRRDGYGKAVYDTVKSFKTIRSNEISDIAVQREFWNDADAECLRLMLSGYMRNDIERIQRTFEEIVPRPKLTIAKLQPAKPSEKPKLTELGKKYPILLK